jgi:hypothetical protein
MVILSLCFPTPIFAIRFINSMHNSKEENEKVIKNRI